MTVFDGRKALWMWEFSQQAEKTLADACQTAQNLAGAGILLVKLMDGADWMSLYDAGGYSSLAQFQADAAAAAASGMTVIPWVVPHGVDPAGEAAAHARLGPVLMLDVEPYTGFWTGPATNLPVYLQALRAGGVKELHISIDPRPGGLAGLGGLSAFQSLVDGIHPQVYWTTFQTPALSVIPLIQGLRGGPPVYPALPGDGAAQDIADVWTAAQQLGCTGASVWRLGSMSSAQLAGFQVLSVPPVTTTPSLEERVTNLEATASALNATVSRLNEVLVARMNLVRTALDPANPPA